jgi:hypothetical protein
MSSKGTIRELVGGWVNDALELGLSDELAHELVAGALADLARYNEDIAKELDDLVQFDRIIPGPIGVLLELGDEKAFRALVLLVAGIDELFRRDPEKQAARIAHRIVKKDARRARRSPLWLLKQALRNAKHPEAIASIERAIAMESK